VCANNFFPVGIRKSLSFAIIKNKLFLNQCQENSKKRMACPTNGNEFLNDRAAPESEHVHSYVVNNGVFGRDEIAGSPIYCFKFV
jgi:hypothetical protein